VANGLTIARFTPAPRPDPYRGTGRASSGTTLAKGARVPELPDVETQRRYVARHAASRVVERTEFDRADEMLDGVGPDEVKRALDHQPLVEADRHGKVLFVRLGSGDHLVLHFGMTGFLKKYSDESDAPEHARLTMTFDDGSRLAFDCSRMFGLISLVNTPTDWIERHDLGPDLLGITESLFVERLEGRRGAIKSALMNQSIFAGLGNVYSDEVLFQARLHPRDPVSDLSRRRTRDLHECTQQVLQEAIRCRAEPRRLPASWLLPHRDDDEPRCPRCRLSLERIEVNRRTSWLCPRCQRPN
jgi:formamidopyrimidine-DNA glycosylase